MNTVFRDDPSLVTDPVESARTAGLRYVTDESPGITRRRRGKGFHYLDPSGAKVQDPAVLQRIEALRIPPAWENVWICPNANGHIQATGRDTKGRKQFRYHDRWTATRNETKFHRMRRFGELLPRIRKRVEADLKQPGIPRTKVLAAIVRLLEDTLIRVGNEEYARNNRHYGLTTLRDEHVEVKGSSVYFGFVAKSGKEREIDLKDPVLARVVKACQEVPGQLLFQYCDDEGACRGVDSSDVNAYLREITGEDVTAKDFRTWAGTLLATRALRDLAPCESEPAIKKNVARAVKEVSERLGNTPAVCRKYYIHPCVVDCYGQGRLVELLACNRCRTRGLKPEERALMSVLLELLDPSPPVPT